MNRGKYLIQTSVIITLIVTLFPFQSFTQQGDAVQMAVQELAGHLTLTPEQVKEIKTILFTSQQQMFRDRQMFGKNKTASIDAAKRRWEMTESHIQSVLTPQQKKKYPSFKHILGLDPQTIILVESINADYKQAYTFNKYKSESKEQAKEDHQKYRQSAKALISAARARRELMDSRIMASLTSEQQAPFFTYKQERDADFRFFQLSEGLMLTESQSLQVKRILKTYEDKMGKPDKKHGHARGGMNVGVGGPAGMMGGGMRGGGMQGGGMPGGGMSGGGMPGGGMRPGGGDPAKMKERRDAEIKMSNAIRQILTQEQLVLYLQIEEMKNQGPQEQMRDLQMRK